MILGVSELLVLDITLGGVSGVASIITTDEQLQ